MMKFARSSAAFRPAICLGASRMPARAIARRYATDTSLGKTPSPSSSRRTRVTPFNDDGHIAWSDLSSGEKAARATQQTFNFGLILAGICMTGGITYLMYTEVFAPDSKVANFSRSLDLIKKDPQCQALLGNPKKIWAHGEETFNKWRRARPIASTLTKDQYGVEHLKLHFHVEGPLNSGIAYVHMTRHPKLHDGDFDYKYLLVDIKGHGRIYLKNADEEKKPSAKPKPQTGLLSMFKFY